MAARADGEPFGNSLDDAKDDCLQECCHATIN
jgi:hypothetical protein